MSEGCASDDKVIDDLVLKLLEMLDNGTLTMDNLNGFAEYIRELHLFLDDERDQSYVRKFGNNCSYNSESGELISNFYCRALGFFCKCTFGCLTPEFCAY